MQNSIAAKDIVKVVDGPHVVCTHVQCMLLSQCRDCCGLVGKARRN